MSSSPHTPLYSAKTRIIARLKEYLASKSSSDVEISTVTLPLENIDLWRLLPFLDVAQKVFFSNREGTEQYLGAKFMQHFNGTFALEQAQEILQKNDHLVILGGQRFHVSTSPAPEWAELGSHYYVLPQFLFVQKNGALELRINIPTQAFKRTSQAMRLLLDVENLFAFKGHAQRHVEFQERKEFPVFEQWQTQMDLAHQAFDRHELDKVVLSRKVVLQSEGNLKPDDLLESLQVRPGEHFIFHLQWRSDRSFTSLTPERLFRLSHHELSSDAIAGTRARGINASEDERKQQELKSSPKEREEHRYVSSAVLETMKQLGVHNAHIEGEAESIMKLTHVQHLHTKISGQLTDEQRVDQLIDAFHPTPAVGGSPKIDASQWLADHESYDRGFYAAPLGMISAQTSDFCVGIRSALLHSRELHIYAGAGIVKASNAQAEWKETNSKMKNFPFDIHPTSNISNESSHEQQPLM